MTTALKAGATYAVIVYFVGFVLGTVRVLLLVPDIGETQAVLLETPVILSASWIASQWSVKRFAVPAAAGSRLAMGGVAFALLMIGELAVSILVFGRSWGNALTVYPSPSGVIGLAAQSVFALLPLAQAAFPRADNRLDKCVPAQVLIQINRLHEAPATLQMYLRGN
jgi:hypothetical protein